MVLGLCFPSPQAASPHHSGLRVLCMAVIGLAVAAVSPAWHWCCFSSHGCRLIPAIPGAASLGLSHLHGFPAWSPAVLRACFPFLGTVSVQSRQGLGHMGTLIHTRDLYQVSGRQRPPRVLKLQFYNIPVSVLCLPVLWGGACAPWDGFGGQGCV